MLDPLIKVIPAGYEHQVISKMDFINPRFPKQKLWHRGTFYKPFMCNFKIFLLFKRESKTMRTGYHRICLCSSISLYNVYVCSLYNMSTWYLYISPNYVFGMRMYEVHCTYLYRSYFSSNLYLVDSGGQYLDGTTDVTRTFHYGTPSQEQVRITDITRKFQYGTHSQEHVRNCRRY